MGEYANKNQHTYHVVLRDAIQNYFEDEPDGTDDVQHQSLAM
jgi:hypothetical protein